MKTEDFQNEFAKVVRFVVEELWRTKPELFVITIPDADGGLSIYNISEIHVGPNGEIVILAGSKLNADEFDTEKPEAAVSVNTIREKFPLLSKPESEDVLELMGQGFGLNFDQAVVWIARFRNKFTGKERTLKEVGAIIGKSKERTRQIHLSAERLLKRAGKIA